jgi:hypothetical protein
MVPFSAGPDDHPDVGRRDQPPALRCPGRADHGQEVAGRRKSAGITVTRKAENAQADDNSPTLTQPGGRDHAGSRPSCPSAASWTRRSTSQPQIAPLLADAKDTEEADSFVNGDGQGNNARAGLIGTLAGGSFVADGRARAASGPEDVYALKNGDATPLPRPRAASWARPASTTSIRQFDENGRVEPVGAAPGRHAWSTGSPATRPARSAPWTPTLARPAPTSWPSGTSSSS